LQAVHFCGIRSVFCHMHVGNQTPETVKQCKNPGEIPYFYL
jgi:hypothetical protein